MNTNYCFNELLKKFKSELERKENYYDDDVCFPPFQRLNHLEVLNEVYALCNCIQEEFKEWDDKKAYLDDLKSRHEELIRKPLFNLIDEVYYCSNNIILLHTKERKATGIFPAYKCSEDFINEHQAIKTYRYHLQATDKDVICDYAFDAINEIWNRIAKTVEREIKKITPHQTPKEEISLPEELNTEEAKNILQKAIDAGFCDANYQWKRTKALLAYFADKTSEYLKLGKGEYGGNLKTSWKPFESLFGVSGLAGAKRDWEKTGTLPQGYKDIDKLF